MNHEDVYAATCMLLTDEIEGPIDAVFFHARAHGDFDDLFSIVAGYRVGYYELFNIKYIFINGADGSHQNCAIHGEAWPGAQWWKQQLVMMGVRDYHIYLAKGGLQTKEENDHFLEIAKEHELKSAIMVAQPHQLLRSFLGLLKSMIDTGYWMRIYMGSPRHKSVESWWQKVYYISAALSPGDTPMGLRYKPRFELVGKEVSKVLEYQAKGDLATFDDLFIYLRERESIV